MGEDGTTYWLIWFRHLGYFGGTSAKCAYCGAELPDGVQSKDDRIDDLMRNSAVNTSADGRGARCAQCGKKPSAPAPFTLPADILQTEAGRYAIIGIGIVIAIALLIMFFSFGDGSTPKQEGVPSDAQSAQSADVPPPAPPPIPTAQTASQPYKPKPVGNVGNWVTANDYPARALAMEEAGTTAFRLEVSATGSVTSCTITQSSRHPDLDVATCKALTRRAKFEPAVDYQGRAVASMYSKKVRWQIPVE